MAAPRASPTAMAVVTFLQKKSSSMAMSSGSKRRQRSSTPSKSASSRWGMGMSAGVVSAP